MLTSDLKKANDIGRTMKLVNILKWMGITSIGKNVPIDKSILDAIIRLRNKSFHGSTEDIDETEKVYSDAVAKLFNIGEQILDFIIASDPFIDDIDKHCLIYGQR